MTNHTVSLTTEQLRYLSWILSCHIDSIQRSPELKAPASRAELLEAIAEVEVIQQRVLDGRLS